MVSRPDKEPDVSVQQGMTHSVVEFPLIQETTSTEDVSSYAQGMFSCGREKESGLVFQTGNFSLHSSTFSCVSQ